MNLCRVTVWLALGTLCSVSVGATAPQAAGLFDVYEIETGAAAHQTVLPGSFTYPSHAELVVIDGPAGRNTRLTVHRLEGGGWRAVRRTALGDGVLFVDTARIGGRDHVILYRHTGIRLFDADTATECCLVPVATNYRTPDANMRIPHIDVTHDVNGDGRDDLLVPDTDGFWMTVQSAQGTFPDTVKLGPAEPYLNATAYGEPHTYGEGGITAENVPWYLGRVHRMDYDRDRRPDLVFWNRDRFEVHRQNAAGGFHATPETFPTDVPFDFDGAYVVLFQFGDLGMRSLLFGGRRFDFTLLHGFRDLNGDGISDLVTLSLAGRRVFSAHGRFNIHYGHPTQGGTAFGRTPDATMETPGPAAGMASGYATQRYLDMDGDGATDIALASVDTGLGGMVRAMAGNSVTMDLALYLQRDGAYARRPDLLRRVRTPFAPLDNRGVLFPTVLIGDLTGDGRADLLTGERWDRLSLFLGVPEPELLTTEPIHVTVEVPADERNAMLADLDQDGRHDVVIHYPSSTGVNRVAVLMTRPSR